jgi:hypothetical protein
VLAPEPVGPFFVAHHKPLYRLDGERERELQAVAAARLVEAVAPDLGWVMRCEVHRAVDYQGDLRVADPDGIVVEAAFVAVGDAGTMLERCHPWVGEPLADWLAEPWGPDDRRRYCYEVHGVQRATLEVVCTRRDRATGD